LPSGGANPKEQLMSRRPIRLHRLTRRLFDLRRRFPLTGDAGMTTAEYAVGTLAACAFAAVLIAVVRSPAVKTALASVIQSALSIAS